MTSLKDYFKTKGNHNVAGVFVNYMRNQVMRTEDEWSQFFAVDSNIHPCIREDNLLLKAIIKGDMKEVNILLDMGHNPLWADKAGKNALYHAMEKQNVPLIKQLAVTVPYISIGGFRFETSSMKPEFAALVKQLFEEKILKADESFNFRNLLDQKALEWTKANKTLPSTIKAFYKEFQEENPKFANVIDGFKLMGSKKPGERLPDYILNNQNDWEVYVNRNPNDVKRSEIVPLTEKLVVSESSLLSYIEEEEWDHANRLLDMGFDPEVVFVSEGTNALQWAIYRRNLPLIKRLVNEFKMDISKPDKKGYPSWTYNISPDKPYDDETVNWLINLDNADAILKANADNRLGKEMALMMKKIKDRKELREAEEKEAKAVKEKELKEALEKKAKEEQELKKALEKKAKEEQEAKAAKEQEQKEAKEKEAKAAKEKEAKAAKEKEAKAAKEKELKDSKEKKAKEEKEAKEALENKAKEEKEANEAKEIKEKEAKEKRYTFDVSKMLEDMSVGDIFARLAEGVQEAKEAKDAKELKEKEQVKAVQELQTDALNIVFPVTNGLLVEISDEREKTLENALKKEIEFQIGLHKVGELDWFKVLQSILNSKTDNKETKKMKLAESYKSCLLFMPHLSLWIEKNPF